jgi:hypothetical protein
VENPFPGIDPWMAHHWGDARLGMLVYARSFVRPQLPNHLKLRIEERHWTDPVSGELLPTGRYLALKRCGVDRPPITMIEILAPWDKEPGEERDAYLAFRKRSIKTGVNHVEIDLLRGGARTQIAANEHLPDAVRAAASRIVIVRAARPDQAEVYPVQLRDRLPNIRIPIGDGPDVVLELQPLLDRAYESGSYDDTGYNQPPVPELSQEDAGWADSILRAKGLLDR